MTAIVGIINRQGVVFAADSAATVTLSSTHKISNHANKIFELSKYQPVGVALCGNMDFSLLPWEQIIKMYRMHLSGSSFATLYEYTEDFFSFVKGVLPDLHDTIEAQLSKFVDAFYNEVYSTVKDKLELQGDIGLDEEMVKAFHEVVLSLGNSYKDESPCDDCLNLTLEEFTHLIENIVTAKLSSCLANPYCPTCLKDNFTKSLFYIIRSKYHIYSTQTVLVFFGYGKDELFPSYYSFSISELFGVRVKITPKSNYVVSRENHACIEPFAQTDVAQTVVKGIDDKLRLVFYKSTEDLLKKLQNEIINKVQESGGPKSLIDVLSAIDIEAISKAYKDDMELYIWNNYISKLIDVVKFLSKEDMADMAESLVKMTGLKRRVTTDEESVGGPVDVAVITKGDGFVWIKRKHYFSSELNPNYFQRTQLD